MHYHSRAVFIDTREKAKELERIEPQLNALGFETIHNKLWVGDYQLIHNPRIVVDRKKDLQELIGNVASKQHARFRNECERAQQHGIKLVVLCEHGNGVRSLDDLDKWHNPRLDIMKFDKDINEWVQKYPKATTGDKLKKTLETMHMLYDVDFEFCNKFETARKIVEILERGVNDE